ncbi:MAG TPA: HAD hydrolase-like protein [Candidatus Saccharimonadales bacterium]|nr:HAD hydrolase-like protein [Candidatus Saccharimonadales bacterium]
MNIIFDFDGTLADMKSLIMEVGNEIAVRRGWAPVDEATYQELSRGSIREGIKRLGIPLREIPFGLMEGKRKLSRRAHEIELFPGIHELVDSLVAAGHELFVLSTNSRKLIRTVLERHGLLDKMTVLPSSGLFGKASALRRFIRSRRAARETVWLIGDELRDIEAAKRARIQCVAVTWGLQHPDTLRAAKPSFVVDTPQQILQIIGADKQNA